MYHVTFAKKKTGHVFDIDLNLTFEKIKNQSTFLKGNGYTLEAQFLNTRIAFFSDFALFQCCLSLDSKQERPNGILIVLCRWSSQERFLLFWGSLPSFSLLQCFAFWLFINLYLLRWCFHISVLHFSALFSHFRRMIKLRLPLISHLPIRLSSVQSHTTRKKNFIEKCWYLY